MQSWVYDIFDASGKIERNPIRVLFDVNMVEKGDYPHYMLKEIYESPEAVRNALATQQSTARAVAREVDNHLGIYFTGMGTATHAAIDATYLFDKINFGSRGQHFFSSIDSSELPYKYLDKDYLVIAITQSGETKETLDALRYAKSRNAKTAVIVNVPLSSAAEPEYSDYVIFTGSGPEIAVPATKSYIGQIAITRMVNNEWRRILGYDPIDLRQIPDIIEETLGQDKRIKELVDAFCDQERYFFIGNGIDYATAKEAALKFKEVSYRYAEAMTGGFLKHGTMSLIDERSRVFAFVSPTEDNIMTHIDEIKARNGRVFSIGFDDRCMLKLYSKSVDDLLSPIPLSVAGHLIAYHYGVNLGNDVDKPRSLAKAVTVR